MSSNNKYILYARMISDNEAYHNKLMWHYLFIGISGLTATAILAYLIHALLNLVSLNDVGILGVFGTGAVALLFCFITGIVYLITFIRNKDKTPLDYNWSFTQSAGLKHLNSGNFKNLLNELFIVLDIEVPMPEGIPFFIDIERSKNPVVVGESSVIVPLWYHNRLSHADEFIADLGLTSEATLHGIIIKSNYENNNNMSDAEARNYITILFNRLFTLYYKGNI